MNRKIKKARKAAEKIVKPAAIIGGVIAGGYVASKLLRRSNGLPHDDGLHEITDADRAIDFQPDGDLEDPRRNDIVGDPSARASVGLAMPGEDGVDEY